MLTASRGGDHRSLRSPRERRTAAIARILCVLYPDPSGGYPHTYPRARIPRLLSYPDGQGLPTPTRTDFTPGQLLGSVSGELGLRSFLEAESHTLVVTSDTQGAESVFQRELLGADVVITQPCWPADLSGERIQAAARLGLVVIAGVGSDDIDLGAAAAAGLTVAQVTHSTSVSAAEYAVMQVLALVHNAMPERDWSRRDIATFATDVARAYDLEGMDVGVIHANQVGLAVLHRLDPFEVHLHYFHERRLSAELEHELGLTFHPDAARLALSVDVLILTAALQPTTLRAIDAAVLQSMRPGSYLVNVASPHLVDRPALVHALQTGQLAGYAGPHWCSPTPDTTAQPPPHGSFTAPVWDSTLAGQARYAAGTREILEDWLSGRPIRPEYLLLDRGQTPRR